MKVRFFNSILQQGLQIWQNLQVIWLSIKLLTSNQSTKGCEVWIRNLSLNVNKLSFFTPFSIYQVQKKISRNVCMFATVDLCTDFLIDGHMSSSCLNSIGPYSIGPNSIGLYNISWPYDDLYKVLSRKLWLIGPRKWCFC